MTSCIRSVTADDLNLELTREDVVNPFAVYELALQLLKAKGIGKIQENTFQHSHETIEKAAVVNLSSRESLSIFKNYLLDDRKRAQAHFAISSLSVQVSHYD